MQTKNTSIVAECGVCVALAVVLSMCRLYKMPMGGSITPFATLPIIVISLRRGVKWGIAGALTFSLIQLLLGLDNFGWIPVQSLVNFALCALLDYIVAYTLIGFTGSIAHRFRQRELGLTVGILATGFGRFVCSLLSGVLIWGKAGDWLGGVWSYSAAYNATWCGPDVAVTLVVCLLLAREPALKLWKEET